MSYAAELAETESIENARRTVEPRREGLDPRSRRDLPLWWLVRSSDRWQLLWV
jgi:hypothetical protein